MYHKHPLQYILLFIKIIIFVSSIIYVKMIFRRELCIQDLTCYTFRNWYDMELLLVIKAMKCSLQTLPLLTNEYFPFVFPTNNN